MPCASKTSSKQLHAIENAFIAAYRLPVLDLIMPGSSYYFLSAETLDGFCVPVADADVHTPILTTLANTNDAACGAVNRMISSLHGRAAMRSVIAHLHGRALADRSFA